tara:strand:+ start:1703 stop:2470 length:768 start_codon:yes stop_codon:yes gene_type:complete
MNNKLKIYVWTSNQQMIALKTWSYLFNKVWPYETEVKILGYNLPDFELPENLEFVSLGTQRGIKYWSDDMYDYFSKIDEDYFHLTMEDAFPIKVDKQLLDLSIEFVKENIDTNLLRFNLTADLKRRQYDVIKDYGEFELIQRRPEAIYQYSLNPSIYNRKHFVDILQPGMSPWDFEMAGDNVNHAYQIYGFNKKYPLWFGHGYKRGNKLSDWYSANKGQLDDDGTSVSLNKSDIEFIENKGWMPEKTNTSEHFSK